MKNFILKVWKKLWNLVSGLETTLPDSVWDNQEFLQILEKRAEEDTVMTRYENGISDG